MYYLWPGGPASGHRATLCSASQAPASGPARPALSRLPLFVAHSFMILARSSWQLLQLIRAALAVFYVYMFLEPGSL